MATFNNNAWKFLPGDVGATIHFKGNVYIKWAYWFNPTTLAHTFLLRDIGANTILEGRCEVANQSQTFLVEGWYNSLQLQALDSGTLYIYIK